MCNAACPRACAPSAYACAKYHQFIGLCNTTNATRMWAAPPVHVHVCNGTRVHVCGTPPTHVCAICKRMLRDGTCAWAPHPQSLPYTIARPVVATPSTTSHQSCKWQNTMCAEDLAINRGGQRQKAEDFIHRHPHIITKLRTKATQTLCKIKPQTHMTRGRSIGGAREGGGGGAQGGGGLGIIGSWGKLNCVTQQRDRKALTPPQPVKACP